MKVQTMFVLTGLALGGLIAVGCGTREPPAAKSAAKPADAHAAGEHAHGEGPHGGTLADWGGGKYHVEFTVDHGKKEAAVYVLGLDEKTAAPIAAKDSQLLLTINQPAFEVTLKAAPQPGEPAGSSSKFVGTHENLGTEQTYAGTITAEVDGTPFAGDFNEEPHDHK
jgi:hypothetical protein